MRIDGVKGNYLPELAWRWSPTAEARLENRAVAGPIDADSTWNAETAEWPEFRGPGRDSRADYQGEKLDWSTSPPSEIWRIPIGPGWSSFAVVSGRLFTQEQRGEREAITCYDADTGELIWMHVDPIRFSELTSGAGPRATPTFAEGKIYTVGAKGMVSCLSATSGESLWQHDLMEETNAPLPVWGFSGSPLVTHGKAIVYAGGDGDNGLIAYDATAGELAWRIPLVGMNFSLPQLATFGEETVVLFADSDGVFALAPDTGELLWRYQPTNWNGTPICQPQQIEDGALLVAIGDGVGMARLKVEPNGQDWTVGESWTSNRLRPSFNDFLYHDGHVFGFNQHIFSCIDASTGKRNWTGGRYGFGQAVLLEGAEQMIVVSEGGQLVLLDCDATGLKERGRLTAFAGKTWNHPVAVGKRLHVRNGEEAVCYEL